MAAPDPLMEEIWSRSGQLQAAVDMINSNTNQVGPIKNGLNDGRKPIFKTGKEGSGTCLSSAEIATATGLPAAVITDLITRTLNPRGL
jgi:hypothetical protein